MTDGAPAVKASSATGLGTDHGAVRLERVADKTLKEAVVNLVK